MEAITDKFIDFIITQKCTYRCKYCSQSKEQVEKCENASYETLQAFYRFIDNLDKDFEITITGGEAMMHPDFFEIINQVKLRGFKINLITNLSFKFEQYQKVFNLLDDNLNRYDISFHIDEIQNFNMMLEKLENFLLTKPENTKTTFFIPLYEINSKKESKIDKIIRIAKKYNIEYSFQKIRFLNTYKKYYSEKYVSTQKKIKTFGKFCYAGSKSAVIYENGNVYRCYSSRFSKVNFIGNLKDKDFQLNKDCSVCTKALCTCPKPSKYFQILEEEDLVAALKDSCVDLIYLPYFIYKNAKIIKTKIKQKFKL